MLGVKGEWLDSQEVRVEGVPYFGGAYQSGGRLSSIYVRADLAESTYLKAFVDTILLGGQNNLLSALNGSACGFRAPQLLQK